MTAPRPVRRCPRPPRHRVRSATSTLEAHREVHRRDPLRDEHFDRWYQLCVTSIDARWRGPRAEQAKTHAADTARLISRRLRGIDTTVDASTRCTLRVGLVHLAGSARLAGRDVEAAPRRCPPNSHRQLLHMLGRSAPCGQELSVAPQHHAGLRRRAAVVAVVDRDRAAGPATWPRPGPAAPGRRSPSRRGSNDRAAQPDRSPRPGRRRNASARPRGAGRRRPARRARSRRAMPPASGRRPDVAAQHLASARSASAWSRRPSGLTARRTRPLGRHETGMDSLSARYPAIWSAWASPRRAMAIPAMPSAAGSSARSRGRRTSRIVVRPTTSDHRAPSMSSTAARSSIRSARTLAALADVVDQ